MIAAIVAPAGVRSIVRMRACLVSGRVEVFGDECVDRERGLDLRVVRAAERVEALGFDLDLVMGSSEVIATSSAAPPQPRPGKTRQGETRSAHSRLQSHDSNAPIKPVSQSNLSNIIALLTAAMACELLSRRGGRLLLGRNQRAERLALSGDPVDQACGIQSSAIWPAIKLEPRASTPAAGFESLLKREYSKCSIGAGMRSTD